MFSTIVPLSSNSRKDESDNTQNQVDDTYGVLIDNRSAGFSSTGFALYLRKTKKTALSGLFDGGDKGSRTPDLLNAIETLYQLSYIPSKKKWRVLSHIDAHLSMAKLNQSFRR